MVIWLPPSFFWVVMPLSPSSRFWWPCLPLLFFRTGVAFSFSLLFFFNNNTFFVLLEVVVFSSCQSSSKEHIAKRRKEKAAPHQSKGTQVSQKATPRRRDERRSPIPKKEDEPPCDGHFNYFLVHLADSASIKLVSSIYWWLILAICRDKQSSCIWSLMWNWIRWHYPQLIWISTFLL